MRHQLPLVCLLSISCRRERVRSMSAEFSFGAFYHRTTDATRRTEKRLSRALCWLGFAFVKLHSWTVVETGGGLTECTQKWRICIAPTKGYGRSQRPKTNSSFYQTDLPLDCEKTIETRRATSAKHKSYPTRYKTQRHSSSSSSSEACSARKKERACHRCNFLCIIIIGPTKTKKEEGSASPASRVKRVGKNCPRNKLHKILPNGCGPHAIRASSG